MAKGEYLQYGGQAVIEGVMMRSPRFFAIACRAPNGEIVVQHEAMDKTWIGRQAWLKWPFFRGSLALLDTIALGVRSMRYATNVQIDPLYQKDGVAVPGLPTNKRIQDATVAGTMVVSLAFGLFLFNGVPNFLAQLLQPIVSNGYVINLISEVIKVIIFLGYIYLIGRLPEIKEVFKYHGAEHKAINTLEADQELSIENVRAQTRLHPRCGTSFAIVVLMVSFVVFTAIPRYPLGEKLGYFPNVGLRILVEICILPIISGIAYEIIRAAGRNKDSKLVNILLYPGLMSQYLTTNDPEERHLEVAIASLKSVMEAETKTA